MRQVNDNKHKKKLKEAPLTTLILEKKSTTLTSPKIKLPGTMPSILSSRWKLGDVTLCEWWYLDVKRK